MGEGEESCNDELSYSCAFLIVLSSLLLLLLLLLPVGATDCFDTRILCTQIAGLGSPGFYS